MTVRLVVPKCAKDSAKTMGPRIGEFRFCCCLPLLIGHGCSIDAIWGPPLRRATQAHAPQVLEVQYSAERKDRDLVA